MSNLILIGLNRAEYKFIYLFIYLFFVSGIKAHSQTTYKILHSQDEKIRKLLYTYAKKTNKKYIKVINYIHS